MFLFLLFVCSPVGFACYFVIEEKDMFFSLKRLTGALLLLLLLLLLVRKKFSFFRWSKGAVLFLLSMLLFLFSGG